MSTLEDMGDDKRYRILTAARSVFLRYGYRRVSMNDIAEAAGMSRPALYLLFENKEDIFAGVVLDWTDETVFEIEQGMAALAEPDRKLEFAFEVWTVRPYEQVERAPETLQLIDGGLEFARPVQREAHARFEAAIAPVLASLSGRHLERRDMDPPIIAHVLASAARGFQQAAATPAELRLMIRALLALFLRGLVAPPLQAAS